MATLGLITMWVFRYWDSQANVAHDSTGHLWLYVVLTLIVCASLVFSASLNLKASHQKEPISDNARTEKRDVRVIKNPQSAVAEAGQISNKQPQIETAIMVPQLACGSADSQGLYDLSPNIIGYCLWIQNVQRRCPTVARNIRAKITLVHSTGDRQVIESGVWIDFYPNQNPNRAFVDRVSLVMEEWKPLILVVWNATTKCKYYAASTPIPINLAPERKLEFGEWSIEILLNGENVSSRIEGKLQLSPTGRINFAQ